MFRRAFAVVLLASALLGLSACEERRVASDVTPLPTNEPEYVVAFQMDTTGSFAHLFKNGGGKAWELMMDALNSLFRDRAGSNDRVIIALVTGEGAKSLLWDGTPNQLRRDFSSSQALADF